MMIDAHRLGAPFDEQQLFALGNRGGRQGFKAKLVQGARRRRELALATIDQHQVWQRAIFSQ